MEASPAESVPPATLAARIQASVTELRLSRGEIQGWKFRGCDSTLREPDQRRHAAGGAVAAIRVEALRIRIGAQPAAVDALDAELREPLSRHRVQGEQPVARARGDERRGRGRIALEK